jgi:hypothetical protein
MKNKIHNLIHAQNLIEEEKLSEALDVLHSLEPIDTYSELQKATFYTLKSEIHHNLGHYKEAYEMAEKGTAYAKNSKKSLEVVDAFINMA